MKAKRVVESLNEGGYWNSTSPYFAEYQEFWNELVPESDAADTLQGELLRMVTRIMYDYYNNGFGNSRKEEAIFLNRNRDKFKPLMKNPRNWDEFYDWYSSRNFGVDDDREDPYEEENYYREQNVYEMYVSKYEEKKIEEQLDDIMDGIVKFVRLTKNDLIKL
jgi:hypothetical protein